MFRFLLKRKRKVASPIINASWCLGGVILRLLSKRIERGKEWRFMIEGIWACRNTAFLECIADSAYVYEVLQNF